jgi:hypothetical protein
MDRPKIELIPILQSEWARQDAEEVEEHKHMKGEIGASGVMHCKLLDALHWSGKTLPPMEGIKAEKGAQRVGKWDHLILQKTLNTYFEREKAQYPGMVFGDEIYIKIEIIPGLVVFSPIDYAIMTAPGWVWVEVQFQNIRKKVKMLHPDAKFLKIWDIKTAGNFGYYQMLRDELPTIYRGQFHVYLKGADLLEITCLGMHKEKARLFTLVCKWNESFWEEVIATQHRKVELVKLIQQKASHYVKRTDLECYCDGNSISWYSCPLSKTYEEENQYGEPKLYLKALCLPAERFYEADALQKFRPGQQWLFGLSHLTIIEIRGPLIISKNKAGTEFKTPLKKALQEFLPMPGEKYVQQELLF